MYFQDRCAATERALSADLGSFEGRERVTAAVDSSLQTGANSRTGEERVAAPDDESRRDKEAEVEEPEERAGAPRYRWRQGRRFEVRDHRSTGREDRSVLSTTVTSVSKTKSKQSVRFPGCLCTQCSSPKGTLLHESKEDGHEDQHMNG